MNQRNINLWVLSEKRYRSQKLLNGPALSYYRELRNRYGKRFLKEELVYRNLMPEEVLQNKQLVETILDTILDQKDQSNYQVTIQDQKLFFTSPNITRKISFYENLIHMEITNHELTTSAYKTQEIKTISFIKKDSVLFTDFAKQKYDNGEVILTKQVKQFKIKTLERKNRAKQKAL